MRAWSHGHSLVGQPPLGGGRRGVLSTVFPRRDRSRVPSQKDHDRGPRCLGSSRYLEPCYSTCRPISRRLHCCRRRESWAATQTTTRRAINSRFHRVSSARFPPNLPFVRPIRCPTGDTPSATRSRGTNRSRPETTCLVRGSCPREATCLAPALDQRRRGIPTARSMMARPRMMVWIDILPLPSHTRKSAAATLMIGARRLARLAEVRVWFYQHAALCLGVPWPFESITLGVGRTVAGKRRRVA